VEDRPIAPTTAPRRIPPPAIHIVKERGGGRGRGTSSCSGPRSSACGRTRPPRPPSPRRRRARAAAGRAVPRPPTAAISRRAAARRGFRPGWWAARSWPAAARARGPRRQGEERPSRPRTPRPGTRRARKSYHSRVRACAWKANMAAQEQEPPVATARTERRDDGGGDEPSDHYRGSGLEMRRSSGDEQIQDLTPSRRRGRRRTSRAAHVVSSWLVTALALRPPGRAWATRSTGPHDAATRSVGRHGRGEEGAAIVEDGAIAPSAIPRGAASSGGS